MQVHQYFYRPQTKFAKVIFSKVFVCPEGVVSVQGGLYPGGFCLRGLCPGGSLSREGLYPGGSLSREGLYPGGLTGDPPVCFSRESLSSCPEGSSVQGVSVQKGVSVQGISVQEGGSLSGRFPPDGREQAVGIQLECILVRNATSWQRCTDYFENNFHISSYQN